MFFGERKLWADSHKGMTEGLLPLSWPCHLLHPLSPLSSPLWQLCGHQPPCLRSHQAVQLPLLSRVWVLLHGCKRTGSLAWFAGSKVPFCSATMTAFWPCLFPCPEQHWPVCPRVLVWGSSHQVRLDP